MATALVSNEMAAQAPPSSTKNRFIVCFLSSSDSDVIRYGRSYASVDCEFRRRLPHYYSPIPTLLSGKSGLSPTGIAARRIREVSCIALDGNTR